VTNNYGVASARLKKKQKEASKLKHRRCSERKVVRRLQNTTFRRRDAKRIYGYKKQQQKHLVAAYKPNGGNFEKADT